MASPPQYLFIPDPDSPIPPFFTLPLEDPHSPLNNPDPPATIQNPTPQLIITANSKVYLFIIASRRLPFRYSYLKFFRLTMTAVKSMFLFHRSRTAQKLLVCEIHFCSTYK